MLIALLTYVKYNKIKVLMSIQNSINLQNILKYF